MRIVAHAVAGSGGHLLAWFRLQNREFDLARDGRPGPIPPARIADRAEAAYAERDRHLAVAQEGRP